MALTYKIRRRRFGPLAFGVAFCFILGSCGGGSAGGPQDAAIRLDTDRGFYFVGESAVLRPFFPDGQGSIEPGIGPVLSGNPVTTPPLSGPVAYHLTVDDGAGRVTKSAALDVRFRDSYRSSQMPFAAAMHAAAVMGDGRVAVIGGDRGFAVLSDSVDLFDPRTRQWSHVASMATGRSGACALDAGANALFVNGGTMSLAGQAATEWIHVGTGTATPGMPGSPRRIAHTCTRLRDGRILVVGGRSNEGTAGGATRTAEIWDPSTGAWRFATGQMQSARSLHSATLLADGRVLLVGGFGLSTIQASFELFDPATEQFTQFDSPVAARASHAAFLRADGAVTIVGGHDDTHVLDSIGLINARSNPAVMVVATLPTGITGVEGIARTDDSLMLFGGRGPDSVPRAESWHVTRAGVVARAAMPVPRAAHSVTLLADGRILILGGETPTGSLVNEALIYD